MAPIQLTLFGGFTAQHHDNVIKNFRSDKVRALLAYLTVEADRPQRRETLAALLWPEMSDSVAKRNLRQSLHRLKQAIGLSETWLEMTRQTVHLQPGWVTADVTRFQQLIAVCEAHRHSQLHHCADCLQRLAEAVTLYQGRFLSGFTLPDSIGFEEWQTVLRERFHQQMLVALELLTTAHESKGELVIAQRYALRQIELEAWRESAHRQLMRLLMQLDKRAEALNQYARCVEVLADELGAEPEAATVALYEQIVGGSFSAETAPPRILHNFPTTLTPFVGRADEIAAIAEHLHSARLVTLIGAGGMGKTRLAIASASYIVQQSEAFSDGIYFVPLAAAATAAQLEIAIANAMNLQATGSQPLFEQIVGHLQNAHCLLVLDNFEQLQAYHPILSKLLARTTHLKLLVTSRQPTTLRVEQRVSVEGLSYPAADAQLGNEYAAVTLFHQAMRRVRPNFVVDAASWASVAQICRLVRGMPLALELAAGWGQLLSSEQIVQEIGRNPDFLTANHADIPDRHRSIRSLFEQTWRQLSEPQQRTLAQLSVFRGYSTLEAILAVTQQGIGEIAALLDYSILGRTQLGNYFLHELLRVFSAEKLKSLPNLQPQTIQRHSHFYLSALAQYDELDVSAETTSTIHRDLDNIRVAWQSAIAQNDTTQLAQAGDGLAAMYHHAGLLQEGADMFAALTQFDAPIQFKARTQQAGFLIKLGQYDAAQHVLEPVLTTATEAVLVIKARLLLGRVFELRDQYPEAITELDQVLAFHREQKNAPRLATALAARANISWRMGEYDTAITSFEEALAIERQLDNRTGIERNLGNLSIVYRTTANYPSALACLKEALTIVDEMGYQEGIARHTHNLGLIYWQMEQFEEALAAYQKAAQIAEALGIQRGVALCIGNMGVIHRELGQWDEAINCYQRAITLCRQIGLQLPLTDNLGNLANLYLDMGEFQQARRHYIDTIAIAEQHDMRETCARLLGAFGELNVAEGNYAEGAERLERSVNMFRTLNLRYYLPQTLSVWANCLVHMGRIEKAATVNAQAKLMAIEVDRKQPLHDIFCNQIRILHAQDKDQAALDLVQERLSQTQDLGEQGDLYYERWLIAGDSADLSALRRCYLAASKKQPHFRFKRRLLQH